MGKIILFYKYVTIQYPKQIFKWQTKICAELGLTGRIILANEGINGTLGGQDASIERYKKLMLEHSLFGNIDFKQSKGDSSCFPRMQIKIKDEIVKLGIDPKQLSPAQGGKHLSPEKVHELLENKPEDLLIFDARNAWESAIGSFKDAIKPDIQYFRHLPSYIDQHLETFKAKKVLMYCTGGVRCERATAYLNTKGVAKEIYQLEGGIHKYLEQYPDGFFRGKNYVFDARLSMHTNNDVLTTCLLCNNSCDTYDNCANASCNKHFVCCNSCKQKFKNTCGLGCQQLLESEKVAPRPPLRTVKVEQPHGQ
ncbi:rhodanese-related sulfurtransferase [Candidatus Dependentiae bacterium]|nr:MAG: rhodanese-related sulfurtransferase [Candidatus Dependentiae bacterium]